MVVGRAMAAVMAAPTATVAVAAVGRVVVAVVAVVVSPDSEEIRFLLWALVVALACCLYAPELDIQ